MKVDLTGQRFGRLTVMAPAATTGRKRWVCRCDCGNETAVRGDVLRAGASQSCGCLGRERQRAATTTHGLTRQAQKLHRVWIDMRRRCGNPNHAAFANYGARGITVCAAWEDFATFHAWAIAAGYGPGLSLDRIDNDGPYAPGNCRWTTAKQQGRNTRRTRRITFQGRTRSITGWAEHLGIDREVLYDRISRAGWPIDRALTTPVAERKG